MIQFTLFGTGRDSARATVRNIGVLEFSKRITKDLPNNYIAKLREALPMVGYRAKDSHYYERIPQICFASRFKPNSHGVREWASYNGIMMLTVGDGVTVAEAEAIKRRAAMLPQTLMAFKALNERSVTILVCATLPDGTLPSEMGQAELFHQQAYRVAVSAYAAMLPAMIVITRPTLDERIPLSMDENPYLNEKAVPFLLMQPTSAMMAKQADSEPERRMIPMSANVISYSHIFEACYYNTLCEMDEWTMGGNDEAFIAALAENCRDAGLPAEEVGISIWARFRNMDRNVLRSMVCNIYESSQRRSNVSAMPKKQIAALRLREFLCRRYDIRYNEMAKATEYRNRYSMQLMYRSLTKRDRNSIIHEAALEGIEAFDSEVNGLLNSSFVPKFNPVEEYMASLPKWDGRDYIGELADMVPTCNANWKRLFSRWFLSMVAHWLDIDTEHANSTAPILIGAQGCRKSTFCRIILPPELRSYYTDSIDFRSTVEAERHLGRYLLINIDEFDQLSKSKLAFVKHMFQKPVSNLRMAYSQEYVAERRYASFMGTSNSHEVLRDPTGNRRYMCVEVTGMIAVDRPIFYEQLYAQALALINSGERTWINDDDERLIREGNSGFDEKSPLEQMLLAHFELSEEDDPEYEMMRPLDIMSVLSKCEGFTRDMNKPVLLGRILRKHNTYCSRHSSGVFYRARLTR